MGCVTKRRGVWVMDVRIHGRRVVKTFDTKREAEEALGKVRAELKQRRTPTVDPFVTFADYFPRFLADCREQEAAPTTLHRYERTFENHIAPTLGARRIRDLSRGDIRAWLLSRREQGVNRQGQKGADRVGKGALSKNTVKQLRNVVSAVLSLGVEDEIIASNPALGLLRSRRTKAQKRKERARVGEHVKALTRDQRNAFLAKVAAERPDVYPAMLLGALGGLRRGEILGLRWASVDFEARQIRVHEQLLEESTKSGQARNVDMAGPLVEELRAQLARHRAEAFRAGVRRCDYVVFPDLPEKPTAKDEQKAAKRLLRAMETSLKHAGLPGHFSLHSLRHTFCALLIAEGVSPVYVQQQAGHASVNMTVGTYGSWFPVQAPGAMDRLAAGLPGNTETESGNIAAVSGNIAPRRPRGPLVPTGTYGDSASTRPSPG